MGDEFAAMFVSEISLWGAAIVACVVLVAAKKLHIYTIASLNRIRY